MRYSDEKPLVPSFWTIAVTFPPPASVAWAFRLAKVAVVPGEAFGAPGYFRFSFAMGDDDLAEGIRRIADLLGRK